MYQKTGSYLKKCGFWQEESVVRIPPTKIGFTYTFVCICDKNTKTFF